MSDAFLLVIAVSALSVFVVLQQIILSKMRRELDSTKGFLISSAKTMVGLAESTANTFKAQEGVNVELHKLISMHHIAIGLDTGVATEASQFLKDEDNK